MPQVLDTVRQKLIEDRETANLFRAGKAGAALERKDRAGLLQLAPGGYTDAIKAGVDEWERRVEANSARPDYTIGMSVPTNADAHAVGLEVRQRARAAGSLGGLDHNIKAIDQRGVTYDMAVAVGERVRLFNRVNASYGHGSRGYFGENGTVAEVVSIDPRQGIKLRRHDGKVGALAWDSLKDKSTGRIRLAYGSALTIDARQGDTLTDHVTVLPTGTKSVDAFRIYPADTRNREDSSIIVSHGAEKQDVCNKRPFGDPWITTATDTEMRDAIMANMSRNLSRQVEKPLAVDFLDGAMRVFHGSVGAHRAAWHRSEIAHGRGKELDLVGRSRTSARRCFSFPC